MKIYIYLIAQYSLVYYNFKRGYENIDSCFILIIDSSSLFISLYLEGMDKCTPIQRNSITGFPPLPP